ncbi:MAG: type II toxin-antitoxin system Phd/YefM family antitoxin [Anaerolineae bacterium]|nr:type II toxin-antitoxin system Phd/YefM family antitoxin [Anaerolineae bacterium]MCB0239683.1 type II toxin-antitoxin system Phd/YefM family antitoxin [Anaerolineae bacterium]MCB9133110.1 type II toxin-antitoxin system Phd/YefM family antitoxin [Anaerolineales bacterium]MCO5245161.1 type II toxin-antitoxin system Phd/YefM family antitoxin [Anaerolineae bacterium]HRX02987.1 type II toxin-antitoxin system Phd/YefM family antitoxin [Anaerolineae bacterium]
MTQRYWQLQEAKNKFSQVVDEALAHGPQVVTRHGVETVVIISYDEFRKRRVSQQTLSQFFRESPLADSEINLERDKSMSREDINL